MQTLCTMKISDLFSIWAGVALLATMSSHPAAAQNTTNFPTLGTIVRLAPELDAALDREVKLEVLSSGFDWAEGPVWVTEDAPGKGYLLFSDIPPNQVVKWVEGEGTSIFLEPSGYTGAGRYGGEPGCNGLLLDAKGQLVSCEHGDRRLSVLTKDGGKRTLVDNFEGKRLNSPNDATYKSNGDLYFTDPPYGMPKQWDDPRRELDFCGVYRLSTDGKLTLLTKEMTRPNGIAFSPDEKILYVAQSDPEAALWKAFPVKADGTLGESRVFFDATAMVGKHKGLPDGMKVDSAGNLWATGPGGVHVFSPSGVPLGRIDTGEATANCGWGGDGSVLYITADMYLCRIQTKVKGAGH
jgi:gluconolactonase